MNPNGGPAAALAAIDVASTATSLLLGEAHDIPLLGCSAAVVSLDAARAELSQLAAPGACPPAEALVGETFGDAAAAVSAVVDLLVVVRVQLRQILDEGDDANTALVCSRVVLHLDAAIRALGDDQP